jgi:hypothetical protein
METDKRTYIVCVDCGKEILYNWQEMRIAEPGEASIPAARGSAQTGNPVCCGQPH